MGVAREFGPWALNAREFRRAGLNPRVCWPDALTSRPPMQLAGPCYLALNSADPSPLGAVDRCPVKFEVNRTRGARVLVRKYRDARGGGESGMYCSKCVGRYEFEYNVFSATIPRRVTIALVGNSAFHGDYKLSPFMFEPFDLREISIHAGGVVYPAVPYKLNFSKDHFVSAFVDMYEALGMANSERSFDISMAQFKKGWTFFVIPLTSTLDDSCGFELLRSGTTNVRATFNSPIPLGGVEMIVLGEFDQMIMVDYNRHIVTDSKLG
ncbi:hypothetical protein niasHT_011753 [Heterodera trifolii]|uniref:Peptidase A1 domain-containing protein n=1 Tax=Heterodera trifolii TaxID=157864 RepID=A0ABD2LGL2_9BILA